MANRNFGGSNQSRPSDADRERVVEALRKAAGDGQITLDELQERLDVVYAARTRSELTELLADLTGHPKAKDVMKLVSEDGVTCTGRWVVPRRMDIRTDGSVLLDFTDAVISNDTLHVNISQGYSYEDVIFIVKPGITVDIDEVRSTGDHVHVSRQTDSSRPGILRITVTGETHNPIKITTRKRKIAATWARRLLG